MVNYVGHEKPDLENLAHYGVIGMKWGKTRVKATGPQIRKARRNVRTQVRKLQNQREKIGDTARGSKEREKEKKKLDVMTTEFLKNPNRVTAHRLTRGEKAIAVILLTPAGAAAAIGASSGISRRIERKQDLKKYDK